MRRQASVGWAIVVLITLLGVYAGSPYWTVYHLKAAIQDGRYDEVNAYVDYPSVRESLKEQLSAVLSDHLAADPHLMGNPYAEVTAIAAGSLLGPILDNYVQPYAIASLLRDEAKHPQGQRLQSPPEPPTVTLAYMDIDRFVVTIQDREVGLWRVVLRRHDAFRWTVAEVIPPLEQALKSLMEDSPQPKPKLSSRGTSRSPSLDVTPAENEAENP
jgi:hypothetical protein